MEVIIGLDESGNGSIAGPIAVAAVGYDAAAAAPRATIMRPRSTFSATPCDSKKVRDAGERAILAEACRRDCLVLSVSDMTAAEVDTMLVGAALRQLAGRVLHYCVEQVLGRFPSCNVTIIIDGELDLHFRPRNQCRVEYLAKADATRWQVGAASLLARQRIDVVMAEVDQRYPQYGFAQHAGYATKGHLEKLRALGPCPAHRRTFRSVMEVVGTPHTLTEVWS